MSVPAVVPSAPRKLYVHARARAEIPHLVTTTETATCTDAAESYVRTCVCICICTRPCSFTISLKQSSLIPSSVA